MNYSIDLNLFSLTDYAVLLKNQTLLPSRKILTENINVYFASLLESGIESVYAINKALSSPEKMSSLANKSGIPENYLKILKREIGSLIQKPVLLSEFPGIDSNLINELTKIGIKTSRDYYEKYTNQSGDSDVSCELLCLSDLVRINGVGAIAAKTFYEAGYTSIFDVAEASAEVMLEQISDVNNEKKYYNARLGVKDMQFCIDFARLIISYT